MQRRLRHVAAPLVAGALIAAACGGSSDGGSESGDTVAEESGDTVAEESGDTGAEEESGDTVAEEEAGDTGAEEEAGDTGAEEEAGDTGDAMAEDMAITRGGTLTYLIEAESDTWDIPGANCAVSCITVMNAVADTLTVVTADGAVEPFLLESFTPNDDFTEYTLVMRDGVTFHDGTPADGAAVHKSLLEMATGLLQGQVFFDLANGAPQNPANPGAAEDSIVLNDDQSVTVSFNKPFATFGNNLAGRTGWLIAPSFWDDPERAGATMIGTGPFTMDNQVRGEVTELTAYDGYWRNGQDGEPLPYLDGVNFRPVPDVSTRRATMEAGDADVNADSFGENKEFWTTDWIDDGNSLVEPDPAREVTYLMYNNSRPVFDTAEERRALALCTDREEYIAFRSPGTVIADGPFAEGSLGFLDDPGFPQYDPEAGNALWDEIGRPESIQYGTTNVPSNLETALLFQDQWANNCGLTTTIDQFEQGELITKAITGDFDVILWRNHGQGHPGLELVWWHSRHAEGLALNFGRLVSPEMDELLLESWTTVDPDTLDGIAQQINTLFAEQVFNLWLNVNEWNVAYRAGVHGLQNITLESGSPNQGSIAGRVEVDEAWIES